MKTANQATLLANPPSVVHIDMRDIGLSIESAAPSKLLDRDWEENLYFMMQDNYEIEQLRDACHQMGSHHFDDDANVQYGRMSSY